MGERTLKYAHAIREAMSAEMRIDPSVVLFGEDVGPYGGVWGVSRGMHAEFGDRVFDTPISEDLIVGMAIPGVGSNPVSANLLDLRSRPDARIGRL